MRRRYKPFLQTNNFIKEIITITIIAIATTATNKDYITLYITREDITYRNILRRNKKNLKLNLELLMETNLVNLITNLKDNLINIL